MKPKFYLVKYNYPFSGNGCYLELTGKKIHISLDEDWKLSPEIDIEVGDNISEEPPEAGKYCQVKRITTELFNSYYTNTLHSLNDSFLSEAEYYIKKSLDHYTCYCYTDKRRVVIEINDAIDYFGCKMYSSSGIKGRNYARKNYEAVPRELMKQIFNLTIELLYDPYSFKTLKDGYFKQIGQLLDNGEPIQGLILNADVAFNEIRTQIKSRIESLENRMIHFDDTKEKRNELRGEMKGLEYCLKIIDENR